LHGLSLDSIGVGVPVFIPPARSRQTRQIRAKYPPQATFWRAGGVID
jgi:hypothetical protein